MNKNMITSTKKTIRNLLSIALLLCTMLLPAVAATSSTGNTEEPLSVERYALYVASNEGSETRETLRYAGTDAESLARTMSDLGGVNNANSKLLIDPTRADIEKAFDTFSTLITMNKGRSRRTEFIFYYSGHSDENALLLGQDSYDYSSLKKDLSIVPSDVHVVMLDSCFSGNFIRTKGGSRQKPFLVDDSTIVQGYAYLSSSSEYEPSQESDAIEGSYFTNAVITGLRGAADTSGDGKVSLNELYYYAFNDTLAKTETSSAGPQHPSYNITLVGSGDLILTDLSTAESILSIPAEASGQFYVRSSNGSLVSQINKAPGKEVALALPAGFYTVSLVNSGVTSQTSVQLANSAKRKLDLADFEAAVMVASTKRGDTAAQPEDSLIAGTPVLGTPAVVTAVPEPTDDYAYYNPEEDPFFADLYAFINKKAQQVSDVITTNKSEYQDYSEEDYNTNDNDYYYYDENTYYDEEYYYDEYEQDNTHEDRSNSHKSGLEALFEPNAYSPIAISLVPGLSFPHPMPTLVNVSVSPFMASNDEIFGVQATGFMGTVNTSLKGFQAAGFMNTSRGDTWGMQAAGFMNINKGNTYALQAAGFMNTADKNMYGVQAAGFMNIARGEVKGFQIAGFMNIAKKSFTGVQLAGFMNICDELNGVSIAPINISNSGNGLPIGVLNFIKDGICEPSVNIDLDRNVFLQYKSGTNKLFTTLYFQANQTSPYTNLYGAGIGSRASINQLSIDVELIAQDRCIIVTDDNEDVELESNLEYLIPIVRATAEMSFFKHFGIYVSYSAHVNVPSWNDAAFTDTAMQYTSLWDNNVRLYHGVSFGLHF